MATCPECDAEIEVDEYDVDRGDSVSCSECGSGLRVVSLSPVEFELAGEEEDEEDKGSSDGDGDGREDGDDDEDWDE